mmetsp:Transcript_10660/g.23506  ORF Transcript_10660/g.23506 Transcript_10660/m.23506 type:complete len:89 (-) Transcript_10660:130-396(-)
MQLRVMLMGSERMLAKVELHVAPMQMGQAGILALVLQLHCRGSRRQQQKDDERAEGEPVATAVELHLHYQAGKGLFLYRRNNRRSFGR